MTERMSDSILLASHRCYLDGVECTLEELCKAKPESVVRYIQELETKLAAIPGLPRYSWSVSGMVTAYFDPRYVRANELEALLKQC